MKIYTEVQSKNNNSYIGVILLGDFDQTYMSTAFKITIQNENSAHLMGIKRALSFVKANTPLYANNDITVYTPMDSKHYFPKSIDDRLKEDEYVQRMLKPNQSIKHNREGLTEQDKYHLMCARVQINMEMNRNGRFIQKERE
jgi:hypothetical protein